MKISAKLRELRKNNNLTLKELSQKSGISVSFISDIENSRRNPSIETLKVLAKALGVSPDEFLKENNIEEKPIDKINKLVEDSGINTIAAHFEGEEFTEDDKEDIENFIKYVLSKKKKKK
jgi:transcriptional regulator with XRE-family HTH domain